LDDASVFFEDVFRHRLPGGGGAAGFDVFKRIGADEVGFAIERNVYVRLFTNGATQVFGDGDDALAGIGGVVVHGQAEAGDVGAEAGEGAVLAVFVEAVLARDDEGAVVAVGEVAQAGPEVDQLSGVGLAAEFEKFFQRIDEEDCRLMFFDGSFDEP